MPRIEAGWLTAPESRAVMMALEAARPGGARFVGGCVRNALRGLAAGDIDIATQLIPEAVIRALEAANIRALPTGIEHGTITAISGGVPVEITTLRRDVETDGRHAVVAFTEDWAEDAARRDFRLNAIYAAPDGTLFEPVEHSVADAIAGRVIFIGEASQRLREDYLRILRFYRFNAWYGAGIDTEGQSACASQRDGLARIAAERIWKELKRLLEAPDPSAAVLAMEEAGVLGTVLPGASAAALPGLVLAERGCELGADPLRRLMALLPRRTRDAETAAQALRMSNDERARLSAWADPALGHLAGRSAAAIREAFYRFGPAAVIDRILVEAASGADPGDARAVLALAAGWQRPVLPVGGADALKAGLTGPAVGDALRQAEEAWIASGFGLSRTELLAAMTR